MDRFKFRAWDDYNKRMYKPFDMVERLEAVEPFLRGFKYLQCTGLKDKHGKLIFEGDIIEHRYKLFKTQPEIISRLEIIWEDEYAAFSGFNNKKIRFSIGAGMKWLHDFEIIGNIYENPELLEDKHHI